MEMTEEQKQKHRLAVHKYQATTGKEKQKEWYNKWKEKNREHLREYQRNYKRKKASEAKKESASAIS